MKNIISIKDLTKSDIIEILKFASNLEKNPKPLLKNKILATLFFEPSTRTRLSFESAMNRLGGSVITVADAKSSSAVKGESVFDAVKVAEKYADIIVIRHPLDGSARVAAEATVVPVINGGDGKNQHPTQTLLDLYTIKKTQKKIAGLNIALAGDLRYGRTAHSLVNALKLFKCKLYFISPNNLKMPKHILEELNANSYSEHNNISEIIDKVDILYLTRIQKERFADESEYEKVKDSYILKKKMLKNVKKNLKIMHPLPRVNEINTDVDDTQYAHYFEQAGNGVPIRMAILAKLLK